MIIKVATICWNEEKILPFFLRHYEQFCDQIIVYDNHSDDKSQEIIRNHPKTELRFFNSGGKSREDIEIRVKSDASLGVEADWIIVVDTDEIIYHPNLVEYLQQCKDKGITVPIPTGWDMISQTFPKDEGQIYDQVKTGVCREKFNKQAVFVPKQVRMNYGPGCHPNTKAAHQPKGNVVTSQDPELKLLHFKMMGLEYYINRTAKLGARKSEQDLLCGYGKGYLRSPETLAEEFNQYWESSKLVI